MPPSQPLVVEDVSLVELINHFIDGNTDAATIVVCSDQNTFVADLSAPNSSTADPTSAQAGALADDEDGLLATTPQPLQTAPTLRFLLATRKTKLVFCPDVLHLRGLLASYAARQASQEPAQPSSTARILLLLNPIRLHRPTSAFSAQGFNRSFGLAVEAAHTTDSRLVIIECPTDIPALASTDPNGDDEKDTSHPYDSSENPWDQELSILNVTTKTFGEGERGWVGRTVKLRTVAERWCRFESWSAVSRPTLPPD